MTARIIAALILAFAVGSCSTSYDLKAILIDGEVAFVPVDADIWGNPDPDCFYSISVTILDGPATSPAAGESAVLVKNGTYWKKTFAVTSCDNMFPIAYGAKLRGPPFRKNYEYEVEAKPLLSGFTYEVSAASNGSAYGSGRFRLTKQGKVENLSY